MIGAHNFYSLPGPHGERGAFNAAYSGSEPLPRPSMTLLRRSDIAAILPAALRLPGIDSGSLAPAATQTASAPANDIPASTVREEFRESGQWRTDAPAAITGHESINRSR